VVLSLLLAAAAGVVLRLSLIRHVTDQPRRAWLTLAASRSSRVSG